MKYVATGIYTKKEFIPECHFTTFAQGEKKLKMEGRYLDHHILKLNLQGQFHHFYHRNEDRLICNHPLPLCHVDTQSCHPIVLCHMAQQSHKLDPLLHVATACMARVTHAAIAWHVPPQATRMHNTCHTFVSHMAAPTLTRGCVTRPRISYTTREKSFFFPLFPTSLFWPNFV